jgi:hypothetical protein
MASLLDLAQARLGGLLAPRPSMAGLLGGQRTQGNIASVLQGYTPPQMTALTNPQVMDYARNVAQSAQQNLQTQMSDLDKAIVMDQGGINVGDRQALARLMEQVPGLMGATAYHASPYKFNKFDPSKVGTGEGAQSYGVGAGYVAQNPKVANEYFKAFTDVESIPLMYKGKKVDTPWNDEISQRWADVIEKNKFTQEQVEDFQGVLGNLSQVNTMQDVPNVLRNLSKDQLKIYDKYIKSELTKPETPEAFMYKVDVSDAAIPKMLDWDKPLTEQPKEVRNMIAGMAKETPVWQEYLATIKPQTRKLAEEMLVGSKPSVGLESAKYWKKLEKLDPDANHNAIWDSLYDVGITKNENLISGSQLYNELSRQLGNPQKASEFMQSKGITGIKYLDAFSRKDAPNPTYNFVPFDPDDMKILETTKGLLD